MGVGIPPNLLLLSGMSAFSFAAAKGITTAKVQNALAQGIAVPKGLLGSQGLIVDLTTNDANQLDLGDFQMLVITLVAVGYYLTVAFVKLGALDGSPNPLLPDVDTTILASFGLGQAAYLTKKAVGEVGEYVVLFDQEIDAYHQHHRSIRPEYLSHAECVVCPCEISQGTEDHHRDPGQRAGHWETQNLR